MAKHLSVERAHYFEQKGEKSLVWGTIYSKLYVSIKRALSSQDFMATFTPIPTFTTSTMYEQALLASYQ